MKTVLITLGLLLMTVGAFAQWQGRLSADDQREFDKYYTKWVNDTRKNDRDDIAKDVARMREIMDRNRISPDVPFDRVASTGAAYPVHVYQGRLSADEQKDFDKYYTKWVNDTRKNDRDDIAKDVRHMQEIMARKNIPANVPFDEIASTGNAEESASTNAYPPRSEWRDRLSPNDQSDFDRYYSQWIDDTRRNDRDEVSRDAGRLQEIMTRNNIPADVPFDRIASPAAYRENGYPTGAERAWQGRLSADDQREFDNNYAKWLEDTRKNDRDDIDRDVRHMQEIMARNSIPADVPFDRIASPDVSLRH
ncbi:MAG TPA: hypothetical protein VHS34_09075 [Terriglobales bacterium]|jgi:hypothetical protein|nr:hypothetical protein [Terriglobales bacterium]